MTDTITTAEPEYGTDPQEGPQTPLGGTVEHLDRTVCSSATMCTNIRT